MGGPLGAILGYLLGRGIENGLSRLTDGSESRKGRMNALQNSPMAVRRMKARNAIATRATRRTSRTHSWCLSLR